MGNIKGLIGNWNETKIKLSQRLALLTDNDLMLVQGKHELLLDRLLAKLGKTKEESTSSLLNYKLKDK